VSTEHRTAVRTDRGQGMSISEVHTARSVFSTQAVDPLHWSGPAARADDLAAELLRCAELCRLAAEILVRDGQDLPTAPTRIGASAAPVDAEPPPLGLRWSVEPVSSAGRSAA
jgi:hypothetical protein